MKKIVILLLAIVPLAAFGQKRALYEFKKNMPVYCDSLIADMKYPLAWGQSDISDFSQWKQTARRKVFECMMTPPPAPQAWNVVVLGEERTTAMWPASSSSS